MSEINPYASPQAIEPVITAEVVAESAVVGVWRKGKLLVMHRRAVLPDRCVKSNLPAHGRLKRSLSWHHPVVFVALLVSPLIYIILAVALRKSAVIHIGLSQRWFAKRRRATLIGWGLVLASLALVIGGLAVGAEYPRANLAAALGLPLLLVAAIYGLIAARLVAPRQIDSHYIWLKGVHPDYLAELPEWPYSS